MHTAKLMLFGLGVAIIHGADNPILSVLPVVYLCRVSIYSGEFMDDKKHGEGKITYIDGGSYTGVWHSDVIVGSGKFTLDCGEGARGGPSKVLYSHLKCGFVITKVLFLCVLFS